ncbi:MAG: hypothetical protein AAFP26_04980 [Planctomycetota bacterium]
MQNEALESLEQQLCSLYDDRAKLEERFGVSTPDDIAGMVSSLEAQLNDFYDRFGSYDGVGDTESMMMLSRIKELSGSLDPMYSRKSVHFSFENNRPTIRAEWTEEIQQGDSQ